MKHVYTLIILLALTIVGCSSSERYYKKGDYVKLLTHISNKSEKNRSLKQNDLKLAERAFRSYQEHVVKRYTYLSQTSAEERWEDMYYLLNKYEGIQQQLQEAMPIRAKNGYTAQFSWFDYSSQLIESREKAANQYMQRADELMKQAEEQASYQSAREAYNEYKTAKQINPQLTIQPYLNKAKELGTITVYTEMIIPRRVRYDVDYSVKNELEKIFDNWSTNTWIEKSNQTANADFLVELRLVDIDVSRIHEDTDSKEYTKQIQVPARDTQGTVIRDTSGNVIMTNETIRGFVEQKKQWKEAEINLEVNVIEKAINHSIYQRYYQEDIEAERNVCKKSGDERAIPSNACKRNDNELPNNQELYRRLIRDIDDDIHRDLSNYFNRFD